jgi:hypothetical protein
VLKNGDKSVNLRQFRDEAADVAREIGLLLIARDKSAKKSRGKKLSTAFPVGKDEYKSKERFKNHFVGYLDGKGVPKGAPAALKMISIIETNGSTFIGITKPGLTFATMQNPILDGGNSSKSFSQEEVVFYFQHISNNLPGERDVIVHLMKKIIEGFKRPNELTQQVLAYGKMLNKSWPMNVANTIRAGLISRLCELGVLEREKAGVRGVAYTPTLLVEKLAEEMGEFGNDV